MSAAEKGQGSGFLLEKGDETGLVGGEELYTIGANVLERNACVLDLCTVHPKDAIVLQIPIST